MFRSRRDQLFRQALGKAGRTQKKNFDRGETFRSKLPYGLFVLWGIFLGSLGYTLFFSQLLDVVEVSVRGSDRIPTLRLIDTIQTMLEEKYMRIFSKRNYFFVPEQKIKQALLDRYPLLQTVTIQQFFPHRIEVSIVERSYLSLWCSGGPCYLIDEESRARSNDKLFYTLYDPWRLKVIDTSALPVKEGELLEIDRYLRYFETLFRAAPERLGVHLEPDASTPSRFSHELRILSDAGWALLVSTEIPVEETLSSLETFLGERSRGEAQNKVLLSIDARVPGRIFFSEKPKEGDVLVEIQEDLTQEEKPKKKQER